MICGKLERCQNFCRIVFSHLPGDPQNIHNSLFFLMNFCFICIINEDIVVFPAGRYSIWIDSKLRLNADPMLIIEYFLWRTGSEYAISNHYTRHCVWEEVLQNKRLNKYNHSVIDEQFHFYQSDGLTKYDLSNPNILLPSCECDK